MQPLYLSSKFGDYGGDVILQDIKQRVQEAVQKVISQRGAEKLKKILAKHNTVFTVNLVSKPPADIEPFKAVGEKCEAMKSGTKSLRPSTTVINRETSKELGGIRVFI